MKTVLRWGRSAYERDADRALETSLLGQLGVRVLRHPSADVPTGLLEESDALVVTSGVRVSRGVLERLGGPYVLTTTSGYDHIELKAARSLGKQVARLAGARRDAVVDTALGTAIELLRRHPAQYARAREGVWARGELPDLAPIGLAGATVAIVGFGVIGRRMAEVLEVCGAAVLGVDPAGVPAETPECSLEDALERADLVTLHCHLTDANRGMLGPRELDRMKETAVLVNTARGPLLDVEAAVQRVAAGRLRGLAVDVFPEEPYGRLGALAQVEGVLLTPHAAGYTRDLGERVAHGVSRAIAAWKEGRGPEYPI
jgi:phosphoglycerate dehydrogenase-like enzyme